MMIQDALQVIIMAGGQGTRIKEIDSNVPKPMIMVGDKPVLLHQLECIRNQGFNKVTIVTGYLGHVIKNFFGSGEDFGIEITYYDETTPLGTAGSLKYVTNNINRAILLINGDIIFNVDLKRMYDHHIKKSADITLFTHPNNHPFDSSLIQTDSDNRIISWIGKNDLRQDYKNRVNAGIHIFNNDIAQEIKKIPDVKIDLDKDVIKTNVNKYKIYAYDSPEYVKDMGTPERYRKVCHDYKSGIIQIKSLVNRQKAFFLDRDGTINKYKGFIINPDDIELIDGSIGAIRRINDSEYLCIIVTNQPVIARGECTIDELQMIHNRIERLLGEGGAFIDDITFCPHHPDRGFEGERLEYKIACDCRKPKAGMLFNMADKYNIDLSKSIMIGDSLADVQAGLKAGCLSIQIGHLDKKETDCLYANDLEQAVNLAFEYN